MSYAIRKDKQGWRAVDGPDDVGDGEVYSETTPPPTQPPAADSQAGILSQILTLEATITPRRQREAILGIDNGWLADVNTQIAALRAKLK